MSGRLIRLSATLALAFTATFTLSTVAAAEPPPADNQIVVAASSDDWISVADASGHVILGRLLHKGDKLALPEGQGFVFTAGNAAATTLLVDGKAAPPLWAESEVARNQPLDPALIAAGRLPAQLAAARPTKAVAGKTVANTANIVAPPPPPRTESSSEPPHAVAVAAVHPVGQPVAAAEADRNTASRIVVAATGDDWISVSDASGRRILGRLLHKGGKLALPEGSGFTFTAGNAAATTPLVDGKAAPPLEAKSEVARNQPLDPALIAAGHLPAQRAAPRVTADSSPAATAPAPRQEKPASASLPAVTAAKDQPARQPRASSDGLGSPASPIVVAATGDDWIGVSDASGRRILGRLLHEGDKLALPEGPGFVFTAGNAGATTLLVYGKAAPPLGADGQVVRNQPLDPALIAAGRLPAQLAARRGTTTAPVVAARDAALPAPASVATQAAVSPPITPQPNRDASPVGPLQKVAMVVPLRGNDPSVPAAPPPVEPPAVASLKPAGMLRATPAARPAAAPPAAFTSADPRSLGRTIALRSGSGQVISLGVPAASVFTADPKVADVRPASPTSLFVLGIAPGETTIAALDQAGHPIAQYRVIVTPSAYGPDAAAAAISRLVPGARVSLSALPDGLTVSGTVGTPADAAKIMSVVRGFADPKETVQDDLSVLADVQVSLQVRIAEMSRTVTRELGVNWQELGTTGGKITANFMAPGALAFLNDAQNTFNLTYHSGNTNVNSVIDALAQDQLARLLAEPNLTAMSGQTASFLVGGEFPIPVSAQNGQISVQFQPYGVSLSFIPTVLADNRISLRVRPEVSELTNQGAVQLSEGNSTIQIPALLVRRAETTVELGSGQSFAIAGLLQDQSTQVDQGLPGLSEIPILGALFNSNSFQHQETELVIIVTPYIVRPVSRPSLLKLPTDNWKPPSDLDRILFHRQEALGNHGTTVARIPGDAGFIAQ